MSEIKAQLLGILLVLGIFAAVGGVLVGAKNIRKEGELP